MPRQSRTLDGLVNGSCKIRKRGCSSSPSASSVVKGYRFKRAILVGKHRGSRPSTPVPTWGMKAVESPKHDGGSGKSRPMSARKLAATLWEMNGVPNFSPRVKEKNSDEKRLLRRESRERMEVIAARSSLAPHCSDPLHSPVSERMDRSETGSHYRRRSSTSHRTRLADHNVGVLDSRSNASLMEIETRSPAQSPSGSVVGVRTRLKDVSNALTTSKELVKIINRVWSHADQPSSSLSLISALHAELERARGQVNHLIQKELSDKKEINYLIKCFASEIEVERKLRKQIESLNKKLGKELAETKASLKRAVKEVESEKRARETIERVCDELARDMGEDKAEVEELKRESAKVHEEVEKEREMLQLADMLREERVQMKLSEAKHQFEEKNAVVDKLRTQLEAFLSTKRDKERVSGSHSRNRFRSELNEESDDGGEVDNGVDGEEGSDESDLHSVELNMDNNNKSYKWISAAVARDSIRVPIDAEIKRRNSTLEKAARRSTSIIRSVSDGVEWGVQDENIRNLGHRQDLGLLYEHEKLARRKSHEDDKQRYMLEKGLKSHRLSSSRVGSAEDFASPTQQRGQPWPSRDPCNAVQGRQSGMKPKPVEAKDTRRPKR